MPPYSHSRISAFETCPLQYRYRYIDEIPKRHEGIEAFVGRLVHEILERIYRDREAARARDAAWWRARFTDLWRSRWSDGIRIVRETMTADHYRELGERCVERYVERHHPFEGGEVLGCEEKVEFALDPAGRYAMRGYIDRIDRTAPGVLEIHDYKTGGLPRPGALRSDRQLSLYEIALRQRWADTVEVRHVWHYLAHDRQFTERRDPEDLRRVRLDTIESIRRIESTTRFPARRSPLCGWCDYQTICPEWEAERKARIPAPAAEPLYSGPPAVEQRTGQYFLFGQPTAP